MAASRPPAAQADIAPQLMKIVPKEREPPDCIVCDRFRLGALRRMSGDGPLSCTRKASVDLPTASLSAALVKSDDQGNVRLTRGFGTRKKALERAGYRSELSGMAGKLEVHHKIPLDEGGDPYAMGNLMVLTRAEHIDLTGPNCRRNGRRGRICLHLLPRIAAGRNHLKPGKYWLNQLSPAEEDF